MSKVNFRILIGLYVVLALSSGFYDLIITNVVVENVNDYIFALEQEEYESISTAELVFGVLSFILILFSMYGFLAFKFWARQIYVLSLIFLLPWYFIGGIYVSSGVGRLLYDLSMVLDGIILALIYFSSVKEYFIKNES